MEKEYFIKLIQRYRRGIATEEECELLFRYYDLFESEKEWNTLLSGEENSRIKDEIKEALWKKIELHERKRIFVATRRKFLAYASAVILFVAVSVVGGYYFGAGAPEQIHFAAEDDCVVSLPDGSRVALLAGSKLTYSNSFKNLDKREVWLEGQASFDVTHNARKPFVARMDKLNVKVLGTSFNIEAWASEDHISIQVTKGKVEVTDDQHSLAILIPNQMLIYDKVSEEVVRGSTHPEKLLISQEDRDLYLQNVTLEAATRLLEAKFQVRIEIADDELRQKRFTTTIYKDQTLDYALQSICEFNGAIFKYTSNKDSVSIRPKEE